LLIEDKPSFLKVLNSCLGDIVTVEERHSVSILQQVFLARSRVVWLSNLSRSKVSDDTFQTSFQLGSIGSKRAWVPPVFAELNQGFPEHGQ
jgi:hypothetical protein